MVEREKTNDGVDKNESDTSAISKKSDSSPQTQTRIIVDKYEGCEEEDDKWLFCKSEGCTFWTRKPERMIRHKACHPVVEGAKYYKCPDCTLKFYSLAKMLKHDRKCHTGVKDYECRVCDAEVTDIQVHMRVS